MPLIEMSTEITDSSNINETNLKDYFMEILSPYSTVIPQNHQSLHIHCHRSLNIQPSTPQQGHLFVAVVWKSRYLQFSATNREIGVFPRRTAKSTIFRDKSRYNLFSATDREISCLCKLKFRSLKLDQTLYNLTKRYKT